MKRATDRKSNRREFLKTSIGGIVAGGCATTARLKTLAAAQNSKPLLTEREFNRRVPSPRRTDAYTREIEEAKRDLLGYLNSHFHLTSAQSAKVKSLSKEDITRLNESLDKALKNKLQIKLHCGGDLSRAGLTTRFTPDSLIIEPHGQ